MNDLLYIFVAEKEHNFNNTYPSSWYFDKILELDMFVTTDEEYNKLQSLDIFNKLTYQYNKFGRDEFLKLCIVKDSILSIGNRPSKDTILNIFRSGKKKRNVGDAFKHIVNDNWKVDMVVTFNLRSLKNYFTLRDSGAAYFQIRWLAQEMKKVTPKKYLDLIVKNKLKED
jgi:thymidylate synthase (FAD)